MARGWIPAWVQRPFEQVWMAPVDLHVHHRDRCFGRLEIRGRRRGHFRAHYRASCGFFPGLAVRGPATNWTWFCKLALRLCPEDAGERYTSGQRFVRGRYAIFHNTTGTLFGLRLWRLCVPQQKCFCWVLDCVLSVTVLPCRSAVPPVQWLRATATLVFCFVVVVVARRRCGQLLVL